MRPLLPLSLYPSLSPSLTSTSKKFFQKSIGNKGLYSILSAYPDKTATAVCTLDSLMTKMVVMWIATRGMQLSFGCESCTGRLCRDTLMKAPFAL